jgi:hypothetical protein
MIIKQPATLAVLAVILSGCGPSTLGSAPSGSTGVVVPDRHWCRGHRFYRYDLAWHQHHCGQPQGVTSLLPRNLALLRPDQSYSDLILRLSKAAIGYVRFTSTPAVNFALESGPWPKASVAL